MKQTVKRYFILLSFSLFLFVIINTTKAMAAEQSIFSVFGMGELADKGKEETVTREQFAKMIVYLSGEDVDIQNDLETIYPDMKKNKVYSSYVNMVTLKGWMSGNVSGEFKPKQAIKILDAARAAAAMLGYGTKEDGSSYSQKDIMNLYYENNLNKNLKSSTKRSLTYQDVEQLFFNMLLAKTKAGTTYFETLGGKIREDGSLNIGSFLKQKLSGPFVGTIDWKSELPFSIKNKKLYVNESEVKKYQETKNDVVYYDLRNKSVWIYKNQVEGTLQSISPNRRNPQNITVDGEVFTIETSQVKQLLSKRGQDLLNTKVTLILGVKEEVAGILSDMTLEGSFTGVILKIGTKTNGNKENKDLLNKYMVVIDKDGKEHTILFPYKSTLYRNYDVVKVTGQDGTTLIETQIPSNGLLCGKTIDTKNNLIGDSKIAKDVTVIDIGKESAKVIPLQKISGMKLTAGQILYYETNEAGEISSIFLRNVVGREENHVLITKLKPSYESKGEPYECEVVYFFDGVEKTKNMPIEKVESLIQIGRVYRLEEFADESFIFYREDDYEVKKIIGKKMVGTDLSYEISDNLQVYYRAVDGTYFKTELDRVSDLNNYKLQAFCDKNTTQIKTVSIILATDR